MGYRVAVVGATGNVGREMLNVLAERAFPCDEVAAVTREEGRIRDALGTRDLNELLALLDRAIGALD